MKTKLTKFRYFQFFLLIVIMFFIVISIPLAANANLLDSLLNSINSFVSNTVSSAENIFADFDVFSGTPETKQILEFENRTQETYQVLKDAVNEDSLNKIIDQAIVNSLSKNGLDELNSISIGVGDNVYQSMEVNDITQNTDVTQHILRQISKQEFLAAEREGILIQQGQEAEISRDVGNLLNAQQLKRMNEEEIRNRRTSNATSNLTTRGWGLLTTPGLNQ